MKYIFSLIHFFVLNWNIKNGQKYKTILDKHFQNSKVSLKFINKKITWAFLCQFQKQELCSGCYLNLWRLLQLPFEMHYWYNWSTKFYDLIGIYAY